MRSSDSLVRILLALTAAVTMASSARETAASSPRDMLRRSMEDDNDDDASEKSDLDSMSDIGKWVRDFVALERRVVEEEAERLEHMVERIEEQQAKEGKFSTSLHLMTNITYPILHVPCKPLIR